MYNQQRLIYLAHHYRVLPCEGCRSIADLCSYNANICRSCCMPAIETIWLLLKDLVEAIQDEDSEILRTRSHSIMSPRTARLDCFDGLIRSLPRQLHLVVPSRKQPQRELVDSGAQSLRAERPAQSPGRSLVHPCAGEGGGRSKRRDGFVRHVGIPEARRIGAQGGSDLGGRLFGFAEPRATLRGGRRAPKRLPSVENPIVRSLCSRQKSGLFCRIRRSRFRRLRRKTSSISEEMGCLGRILSTCFSHPTRLRCPWRVFRFSKQVPSLARAKTAADPMGANQKRTTRATAAF